MLCNLLIVFFARGFGIGGCCPVWQTHLCPVHVLHHLVLCKSHSPIETLSPQQILSVSICYSLLGLQGCRCSTTGVTTQECGTQTNSAATATESQPARHQLKQHTSEQCTWPARGHTHTPKTHRPPHHLKNDIRAPLQYPYSQCAYAALENITQPVEK